MDQEITAQDVQEIRQVIARLKRRNELDALATDEAESEAASIMLDLFSHELTDKEAAALWASATDEATATDQELKDEVRAAVDRASAEVKP